MNKIQNIIKRVGVICFAIGTITACSEYNASRLNVESGTRTGGTGADGVSESKYALAQPCNDCGSLCIAAMNGHEACVKALVDAGADVNASDEHGRGALMYAARKGKEACAKVLIDAGANVNARVKYGFTALMFAAMKGYTSCISALIEAGADVDATNNLGNTALMYAAICGYESCVMVLLEVNNTENRINMNAVNRYGETALKLAIRYGNMSCVRALAVAARTGRFGHPVFNRFPVFTE